MITAEELKEEIHAFNMALPHLNGKDYDDAEYQLELHKLALKGLEAATPPADTEGLVKLMEEATPGVWQYRALGGAATVLCDVEPVRNDTRIPGFGYSDRKHCIGYVCIDDNDENEIRRDFVLMSHADAQLVAATRNALPGLLSELAMLRKKVGGP